MLSLIKQSYTNTNSCGKETFIVSDIELLKRFLVLGSETGTYYISQKDLTKMHIECLERLIKNKEFQKILDLLNEYSTKVYKKDYLIFVLARICAISLKPDEHELIDFRNKIIEIVLQVCTIPTHLFMFIELYKSIKKGLYQSSGWNPKIKNLVSSFYNSKSDQQLCYHITKYQSRNNWTHKDLIRLIHLKDTNTVRNSIYRYIIKGELPEIEYLRDFERLKSEENLDTIIELMQKHNFVREHLPTQWLNEKRVWEQLYKKMPLTAMLRNLNKLTSLGVIDNIDDKLTSESIRNAKVHPLQILIALKMYNQGKSHKGKQTWAPIQKISNQLNDAFYKSFENVEKIKDKKILIAMDVSGSMTCSSVCGIDCMMASEVSCAMAMVLEYQFENVDIMGFSDDFVTLPITYGRRLDDNLKTISNMTFGRTDISLPFKWANQKKKKYDCVIVFTDCETNCNSCPPSEALRKYRKTQHINTKLIVCATSSNSFTIADPNDMNMLDVCGFDSSVPTIINDFIKN